MTTEEKELLLKDLCARLPYGVVCEYTFMDGRKTDMVFKGRHFDYEVICKPYLRPMESMTLKEESELCKILGCDSINVMYAYANWSVGGSCDMYDFDIDFKTFGIVVEWLNKNKFDYRGLIPKGLALEAPKDMYVIK